MDPKQIEALSRLAETLHTFDSYKFYIISILVAFIIVSYILKLYFENKKKEKVENMVKTLISEHDARSGDRDNRLIECMQALVSLTKEMRDRQADIINKTDSLRIIRDKIKNMLEAEIMTAVGWSIDHNHYEDDPAFVRKQIKSDIAKHVDRTKKSIKEFNLAIDIDKYFDSYIDKTDNNNMHYAIVDKIWDLVEPCYHHNNYRDLTAQVKDMEMNVTNFMNTFINSIEIDSQNLYKEAI